jgi:small subunit ribosomal protein S9
LSGNREVESIKIMESTKTTKEKNIDKVSSSTSARYIEAVGRRKTSIARVRMTPGAKSSILINDKDISVYFPTDEMRFIAVKPLEEKVSKKSGTFAITVRLSGGGIHSQAEALSHGIARALVKNDGTLRKDLKHEGFLKRDPRAKERRKFGLKKARKAPKWSKR